jgi:hypothetical protein
MGPLGQAPIGSRSPDRWVPLEALSSWPTDQLQGIRPVRRRVRPATEGTHPHHRREKFLYELQGGLRAAACGGRPQPLAPGQPTYRVSRRPTAIEEGRDLSSMSGIHADSSYRLLPV